MNDCCVYSLRVLNKFYPIIYIEQWFQSANPNVLSSVYVNLVRTGIHQKWFNNRAGTQAIFHNQSTIATVNYNFIWKHQNHFYTFPKMYAHTCIHTQAV